MIRHSDETSLQEMFGNNYPRMDELFEHVFDVLVNSARSARRLATAFNIRRNMVGEEVSPADIIAWELLQTTAPELAQHITTSPMNFIQVIMFDEHKWSELTKSVSLHSANIQPVKTLMTFLFPKYALHGENDLWKDTLFAPSFSDEQRLPTDIRNIIPFLKLVRLGMSDDFIGRKDIQQFLIADEKERQATVLLSLHAAGTNRSISEFWRQFERHAFHDTDGKQALSAYQSIIDLIQAQYGKEIGLFFDLLEIMPSVSLRMKNFLDAANIVDKKGFMLEQINKGNHNIVVPVLIRHIYEHGLFGVKPANRKYTFLDRQETKQVIDELFAAIRASDTMLITSHVRYILQLADRWTDNDIERALQTLQQDDDLLHRHLGQFFTSETPIGLKKDFPEKYLDEYLEIILDSYSGADRHDMHERVKKAFGYAIQLKEERDAQSLSQKNKLDDLSGPANELAQHSRISFEISPVEFDYSTDDGIVTFGSDNDLFLAKFSKASNKTIHLYTSPPETVAIARAKNKKPGDSISFEKLDSTSRFYRISVGEYAVLKNGAGKFAIIRIDEIKDDSRGNDEDWVKFSWKKGSTGDFKAF